MFLNNKYTRWYEMLIAAAKAKSRSKGGVEYYEKHHVIPKSLGGNDAPENLVLLTAREHYLCHLLLVKMTEGILKYKMTNAFSKMVFCASAVQQRNFTASQYETARRVFSAARKGVPTGIPAWNKGLSISDPRVMANVKNAMRTKATRTYITTEEKRVKISQHSKNRPRTSLGDAHKKAISNTKRGVLRGPHKTETRVKQGGVEFYDPDTKKVVRVKTHLGEMPPNGWLKGRLLVQKRIWITNGEKNVKVLESQEIPQGFFRGRNIARDAQGAFA